MNTVAVELWDNESLKCTFYTVRSCQFAKKIEIAIQDGEILIDEHDRILLRYNGSEEIYL